MALAAPALAAAATVPAPPQRWPASVVVAGVVWAVAFLACALPVTFEDEQLVAGGLLAAAAELAAAVALWCGRSRRRARADGDDGGGGGPRRDDGPRRPPSPDEVDWDLWEESFRSPATVARGR